jgi:hypothetical protein
MLVRSFLIALALITPASAAEFYIVQDVEKQTCAIAQEPPKDERHAIVGEGAYNDETSATADMTKMLVCNPRDATSGVTPQAPTGLKTQ